MFCIYLVELPVPEQFFRLPRQYRVWREVSVRRWLPHVGARPGEVQEELRLHKDREKNQFSFIASFFCRLKISKSVQLIYLLGKGDGGYLSQTANLQQREHSS